MIPAWIRQFFGTKSRAPIARRHAKVKPSVLVLEDRWMPAPVPVAAPTEAALTTAIMTAADGDTIVFQSPAIPNGFVFDLMTPHPPAGNSYFLLNKTLTFDASSLAAGVTLNATVAFRIFEVAPTFSLALNRISMTNGAPVAGQSGGAVLFNGGMGTTFSITGGTFSGNDTLGAGNGGAIDVLGGVFTASGTTFTTNTAGADGGAIHIGGGGAHSLTNCNLTTNSAADDGGAIELDGGTLSLNPSTVDTNTAADDGGGINVTGGTLNVSPGAQITNNTSTNGNGGGINIAGGTNHQLIGSIPNPIIIGGNRALNTPAPVAGKGHGGGINLAAGDLDLRGAQIGGAPLTTANQAVFGGGISILGGTLTANVLANPSQVKGNTATSAGGGIDIVAGIVTVSAMSATDNSVTGVNGHGGGYAIHGGTVNLSDPNASPILRNHADAAGATGGGIFQDGGTVNLTNIVVGGAPATGNTANSGAGIHVAGGTISLLAGTNVNNNTAATSGGGMLITGGTNHKITGTAMSLVSVSGNRALAGNGGGIQIAAPFASTLTSDPFMMNGNMAVGDGGGMNITVGTVIITAGDFFTNNTATGNGGGLNYAGGTGHQINGTMGNPVIIANNTAGVSGGGINLAATFTGTLAVTQTVIGGVAMFVPAAPNGNVATLGSGGGINVDIGSTGTLTLTGGRIGGADAAEGNKANISGGGINFAGGAGHTLMTALIAQNATTTGAGGGVNLAAAGVAVAFTDSTIRGNTANTSGGGFNVVVGTLSLTNCTVGGGASGLAGNVATTGDGGGLNVLGGTVNLNGGTIGGTAGVSGNTASGNGGGIEFAGGTINFIAGAPTVVRFNHATGGAGGGLDISANLNLSIDNGTDFLDNDASTNGGGIAQRGNNALSISNVANSADILRNTANNNDGGGLFLGGSGNTGLLNVNINANVAAQNGGGISKGGVGVLTINIATLDLNRAESGDGGGMSVVGGVAGSAGNPIARVTFSNNFASNNGGGVAATAGTLRLNNCTISGNEASNDSGLGGGGGGIFAATTTTLTNVTVAANRATGLVSPQTGGIRQTAGLLSVQNTLVGDNTGLGAGVDINTAFPIADGGFNLFETFAGFAPIASDVTGQTPLLAPLFLYAPGPNATMALLPGSPAIDAGTGAGADQRGVAVFNGIKDIGAFESRGFTFGAKTGTPQSTVINTNFALPLTVVVTPNSAGEPVDGGQVTFTAPAAGASITVTPIVATIMAGSASSGTVTANAFFGMYNVGLTARGAAPQPAAFALTNLGVDDVSFSMFGGRQPVDTRSGQPNAGSGGTGVIVQLLDQLGAALSLANVPVTVQVNTGPGTLTPTVTVTALTDAMGRAIFSTAIVPPNGTAKPLVILTTGTYTLRAEAPRSTVAPSTGTDNSNPFNITASKLIFSAQPSTVRSGAAFAVTVQALGEDNSLDPNFNSPITVGINTFALTGGAAPPPTLGGTTTQPAAGGIANFPGLTLNRGGSYTLSANSGMLTPGVSAPIKVNASSIAVVSSQSAGSTIPNPLTGGNVMPPNSVRSSNQVSIVDANKDILIFTVAGFDITGQPADIAAGVSLTVTSATQVRNGVLVNIPTPAMDPVGGFRLEGNTTLNAPASTVTFGQANAHLTLNRWGDYIIRADAMDGMGFAANAFSGTTTVIARQIFVVNPPFLVIGPFTITTAATDVTGDVAQNYTGPSDPTQLSIRDITNRQVPPIDGTMGTTTTTSNNTVIARANPFRGITVFNFNARATVLVNIGVIDQFQYFIGSDAENISVNTLDPGRRRPRPLPPVLTLRIRPN